MKKFVSMFMALVMVFAVGPVVVARAEDECFCDECRLGPDAPNTMTSTNSTGWAWCKENPKDCATYLGEAAWDGTKLVGGKVWDGTKLVAVKAWDATKLVCDKVWVETAWVRGKLADGSAAALDAVKNYNYTQMSENMKWCAHNVGDCAISVYDGTIEWVGDRADELATFKDGVENFYNYDLNNQAKWPFWSMVGLAAYQGANVAWGMVKLPFTLVMRMLNPCFRAKKPPVHTTG